MGTVSLIDGHIDGDDFSLGNTCVMCGNEIPVEGELVCNSCKAKYEESDNEIFNKI